MGGWMRGWTAALVLAATLSVTTTARSQDRIVFTEFENDVDRNYEDLVADELLFRNDYQVVNYEDFIDEVDSFGVDLREFLDDPGLVIDLAWFFEYDAIVWGQVDDSERPREVTIVVYDGSTGLSLGDVIIPLTRGQIDDRSLDEALVDIEDLIDRAERPGDARSEEVSQSREPEPEPARRPRGQAPDAEVAVAAADSRPSREGWLHLEAGFDVVQRHFTLVSSEVGIEYDSGFYPGVAGGLELYPIKLASPGTLDGLGIRFRLAHYFVDTVLVLEGAENGLDIPTRHQEIGIGLLYRHEFGRFELLGRLGWERLSFTLGDNAIYESSEYAGIAVAVGGAFAVVRDLLRLGAEVEIRPAPSLGDSETQAFGPGSAFGFAVGGNLEVTPFDRFAASVFYRFQQFSNSFDGTGSSELTGSLEATDTYQQFGLKLGYAY